jgi:hypothetical protein
LSRGILKNVKQELINEDTIHHTSDGGVSQFSGQEIVNDNEAPTVDPQDQGVPKEKRNMTPMVIYVPSHYVKVYAKERYRGVGSPLVQNRKSGISL